MKCGARGRISRPCEHLERRAVGNARIDGDPEALLIALGPGLGAAAGIDRGAGGGDRQLAPVPAIAHAGTAITTPSATANSALIRCFRIMS